MDIMLKIGTLYTHNKLSTYSVQREITYDKVITTMDGVEHASRNKDRYIVSFSFFPMTESEATEYCSALSESTVSVTFTDPYTGTDIVKTMRTTSNLDAAFDLVSVDGKRRYKGGTIQMREI